MSIVAYAVKFLIAGLFLHAGASKLHPQNNNYYREVLEGYAVVPTSITGLLPKLIGLFEVLIAAMILLPQFSKLGLLIAAGLLSFYLAVFAKQLLQGRADINCGCAGPGVEIKISPMLLLRNAILISLCMAALNSSTANFSNTWFLVLPLAVMLGLIYLSSEQLLANQQKIEMLKNT